MNTWTCPSCNNVNPTDSQTCLKCNKLALTDGEEAVLKCFNEAAKETGWVTPRPESEFVENVKFRSFVTYFYNLAGKNLRKQVEELQIENQKLKHELENLTIPIDIKKFLQNKVIPANVQLRDVKVSSITQESDLRSSLFYITGEFKALAEPSVKLTLTLKDIIHDTNHFPVVGDELWTKGTCYLNSPESDRVIVKQVDSTGFYVEDPDDQINYTDKRFFKDLGKTWWWEKP